MGEFLNKNLKAAISYCKKITTSNKRTSAARGVMIMIFFAGSNFSFASTVTTLTASYSTGQVFLTWKNPNAKQIQYNVYRSTTQFTSSAQFNSSTYIGFVRDSSSKNIHLSAQLGHDMFYKITDNGQPLSIKQGLYVVTCTDNQSYYYAVTVMKLRNNTEDKTIVAGQNILSVAIQETVAKPQPVYQDSSKFGNADTKFRYVQFVNNQETPLYPSMNSTGSYGFNFFISKRGNATSFPLYVVYVSESDVDSDEIKLDTSVTNCYFLGVDDWLPIPGMGGHKTFFCCYHENFNIYSNTNPIPTTGVVKTYPQKRYIEAIRWAKTHLPIDSSRVYTVGTSATGFGAMLTGVLYPNEITAVYTLVEPLSVRAQRPILQQMWGATSTNLSTDVLTWDTNSPINFNTLSDLRLMMHVNEMRDQPILFDVHGKGDVTVIWNTDIIAWYYSLENNRVGGVFYWDDRNHTSDFQDFLDSETKPDFVRYQTTKSYPAFTNCSINQNPGNGTPSDGDPDGAINAYLDWDDDIADNVCTYSIITRVKDLYVGGTPFTNQYSTCFADVTLRRLQNFRPTTGALINWYNYNASSVAIQNGSFTYNGGLITLNNIQIDKTGSNIQLNITGCQRDQAIATDMQDQPQIDVIRNTDGYLLNIYTNKDEGISLSIYNIVGQRIYQRIIALHSGSNKIQIPMEYAGLYIAELKGSNFSLSEKLIY